MPVDPAVSVVSKRTSNEWPIAMARGCRANFYTDQAILRIRDRNRSRPFYLHQTYQSVHKPFEEPPSWEEMPEGEWWDHVRFSI